MSDTPLLDWQPPKSFEIGGKTFDQRRDGKRLGAQLAKVQHSMADGKWRTLAEIAWLCECPEASASARLRDLRKLGFMVEREFVGLGLHRYRVIGG